MKTKYSFEPIKQVIIISFELNKFINTIRRINFAAPSIKAVSFDISAGTLSLNIIIINNTAYITIKIKIPTIVKSFIFEKPGPRKAGGGQHPKTAVRYPASNPHRPDLSHSRSLHPDRAV